MGHSVSIMENRMEILKKLKREKPYDSANPPLATYSRESKSGS
jgi:hypothetical protein